MLDPEQIIADADPDPGEKKFSPTGSGSPALVYSQAFTAFSHNFVRPCHGNPTAAVVALLQVEELTGVT